MELELATFDLPLAIDNARTFVRERASKHGIALDVAVDDRLGDFLGDERKIKQILLNLLSNAVKFTPEGGRIGIDARQTDGYASGPVEGLRILDLGCGKGRFSRRARGRGGHASLGSTSPPGMLAEASGIHRVLRDGARVSVRARMLRRDHRRGGVRAP